MTENGKGSYLMSEIKRDSTQFIGYEYKEIDLRGERASMYLDCYPSFGWEADSRSTNGPDGKTVTLKRNRKIVNKAELTRLQRHFEACMKELDELERSRTTQSTISAIIVGIIGTVFMACSTFAAVHEPPLWILTAVLAVPGFIGWVLPVFIYRRMTARRSRVVAELMEQKYDEIYEICEKGNRLLL